MLTQQTLKEYLHYNPNTGIFVRIKDPYRNPNAIGNIAGGLTNNGYIDIRIKGKKYPAHHLAWMYMYGDFSQKHTDHINHDKTDNRISNLREVSILENTQNRSKRKDNKSGFTGIIWKAERNKWFTYITVNKKKLYLGIFTELENAIAVRKQAEIDYGFHCNHGI